MEARQPKIGAVVLAAGMSSRMGEPKQLLRLGERTVLGQTLECVRHARIDDIVVVLGFAAETIVPQIASEGINVVINQHFREGMGTSLRTGLGALDADVAAAFVVLADQPFVQPATLNSLIDQYRQSKAQIVIPLYRGFRGNPVLLDRSVFPEVMALTGDIGCRAIFGDHADGILKVQVDDVGILLDIDSKDDFEKLRRLDMRASDDRELLVAAELHGREIPDTARPDELVIVGTEPVAIALAKLGNVMDFRVTVVAPLLKASDLPEADRVLNSLDFCQLSSSSGRYVVVASRGQFDEEAVEQALYANSNYVAVVANQKRAQELRRRLESKRELSDKLTVLRAPAGLDISAETPAEIALSIMAEIISLRRKGSAGRARSGRS